MIIPPKILLANATLAILPITILHVGMIILAISIMLALVHIDGKTRT